MCVFCAAIPAAASLGVVASSRQQTADKAALAAGEQPAPRRLPAGRLSAAAVVLLVAGSVYYHTHFQA